MTVDQQAGQGRHRPAEQADRPAPGRQRDRRHAGLTSGAPRRARCRGIDAKARPMNADLHCHSTVSDGTLEPEALAARAKANGVELWALTDHDEIGGQQRARDAAARARPALPHRHRDLGHLRRRRRCTSSASASTPTTRRCGQGLAATRGGRERARARDGRRAGQGRHPRRLRRRAAVRRQPGADLAHALRALPGRDAASAPTRRRCSAASWSKASPASCRTAGRRCGDAVRWITDAGGIAVIAHPARYKFTPTEEYALFTEFKAHGGRGVEVVTGSHTRRRGASATPRRRASSACSPRAAATSTAPTRAASTSAACRRCPAGADAGVGGARGAHPPRRGLSAARQRADNRRMSQYFEVHPRQPAAAPAEAGGADPARRRRRRDPDRLELRPRLPPRRQGRGRAAAAHPRRRRQAPPDPAVPRPVASWRATRASTTASTGCSSSATPGPFTFILEATKEVPRRVSHPSRRTIGLRVPDHPVTQAPARPARPAAAGDDADRARRDASR